jgi:hypothetical protein
MELYQNYINHISLVVDMSGSMQGQPVVSVFDKELEYLKQRSIELNQETRISIYLFNYTPTCLVFDMDVMRLKSLAGYYRPTGQTALIDAVLVSIKENQTLPQIHGDHAFLQYVITDGMENSSRATTAMLSGALHGLQDNWTTACLVPDMRGKFEAQKFGFPTDSIAVWDTAKANAFEGVGKQFSGVVDNYMTMRSSGVRGTKSLFTLSTQGIAPAALSALNAVDPATYDIFPVHQDAIIKNYVESFTNQTYRLGSTYYQPTKTVRIQDHKVLLVQDIKNGRVYEGSELRRLLGLPADTVEVNPEQHGNYRVFVQSTSVNRKLYPNTFILVRK